MQYQVSFRTRIWYWKHVIFTRENIAVAIVSWKSHLSMPFVKWFSLSLVFMITNRILHGRLDIWNFTSCVEKYFTCSLRSLEEKFHISTWPCNILYAWFSRVVKEGAYYCYCAYVLRISRYSDFLSVMLTNTGIFLRGFKLSGESRS